MMIVMTRKLLLRALDLALTTENRTLNKACFRQNPDLHDGADTMVGSACSRAVPAGQGLHLLRIATDKLVHTHCPFPGGKPSCVAFGFTHFWSLVFGVTGHGALGQRAASWIGNWT
jgi:hypothetical protein